MENVYRQLQRKLNTIGLGFPETDEGYELIYLAELYTEDEAEFALKMDLGLHSTEEIANSMCIPFDEADERLRSMAARNLLMRVHDGDTIKYYLLPVVHGFLEFNLDRFNPTIARYFSKHYMNGMGSRFYGSEEPLFRILPIRSDIVEDKECLPIDNWETILRRQKRIAVTECFCRKSTNTNPKATGCSHNEDFSSLCLALGMFADFYVENGTGREISLEEALEHMKRAEADGNVVEVLNSENVEVMCSCCDCCCGVLKAMKLFGGPAKEWCSNYAVKLDQQLCILCNKCIERCPMNALSLVSEKIQVDYEKCIGCGLCVTTCPTNALKLYRKPEGKTYEPSQETILDLYDHLRDLRRKTREF